MNRNKLFLNSPLQKAAEFCGIAGEFRCLSLLSYAQSSTQNIALYSICTLGTRPAASLVSGTGWIK